MAHKVKTITLNGKVSEYDVIYTKAYVAKIISSQSDLYQEIIPANLPHDVIKQIYVNDVLEAELIGSKLYAVIPGKKPKHDPYVDRHEPEEEFDESHALDMVMNNMLNEFTDEELEELAEFYKNEDTPEPFATDVELAEIQNKPTKIYLHSVTAPPPYWVTDTTLGDVKINYSS